MGWHNGRSNPDDQRRATAKSRRARQSTIGADLTRRSTTMFEPAEIKRHLREAAEIADMPIEEIVLPADRYLDTNGLRIHYLDWGMVERPPVLFLHGRSLTAHTWDLVSLALRPRYRCLALDLRGHGDSSWSPEADYTLDAHCADLEG